MAVSSDYFTTMGIPLRQGRVFSDRDADGQPGVVVVGESLAARVWPGQNPIGKRLKIPMPGTSYHKEWLTVIGVAGDARYRELQATRLDFYMSHLQADIRLRYLTIRTVGEPSALAPAVRALVRDLDNTMAVTEIAPMGQIVSQALGTPRFTASILGVFGFMALTLAALGVYGLLAYSVTCRTQEIGIRMALGARAPDVLRSVLGNTFRLVLTGTAIGLLLAALLVRTLETLLFGVEPSDPGTFAIVPVVLFLTAFVACLVPAWRAVRVDPLAALKYE
jgi:putative ABC transport system permease protein